MYQANHDAIVQNLNYDLVMLRQNEVLYFVNFFSTFGTQAALMAGFLAASISQVPGLEVDCHYAFKQTYWISTSIGFVGALHVLICTVFLAVYGQGLALRGPVGSMMTAVEGMVYEQEQVVGCFIFTVVFFTISTVATFFIMVPIEAAIVCTILMLFGIYAWYHYVLRIYNRFQYKKIGRTWSTTSDDDTKTPFTSSNDKVLLNDERYFRKSVVSNNDDGDASAPGSHAMNDSKPLLTGKNNKNAGDKGSFLNKFKDIFSKGDVNNANKNNDEAELRQSLLAQDDDNNIKYNSNSNSNNNIRKSESVAGSIKNESFTLGKSYGIPQSSLGGDLILAYSGYITMNVSNSSLFSDEWKRRFIVVNNSLVFYYNDKVTFEKSPSATLKSRPTDLEGYRLQLVSDEIPFVLQLVTIDPEDDRKGIIFQCDTKAEADQWIAVFNTATQLHNM
jgi:hypothetical protein